MRKKSTMMAILLGIFGFGGFYAAGFKKGLMLFLGTSILIWFLASFLSPDFSPIGTIVSVYVSYKWTLEYNAALSAADGDK